MERFSSFSDIIFEPLVIVRREGHWWLMRNSVSASPGLVRTGKLPSFGRKQAFEIDYYYCYYFHYYHERWT